MKIQIVDGTEQFIVQWHVTNWVTNLLVEEHYYHR
jgi:hypothetical protein